MNLLGKSRYTSVRSVRCESDARDLFRLKNKNPIAKACSVASEFSKKPPNAWKRTKHRFREIALSGFEEAFRAGVLGQQEAYAKGEPQEIMTAFLQKKLK